MLRSNKISLPPSLHSIYETTDGSLEINVDAVNLKSYGWDNYRFFKKNVILNCTSGNTSVESRHPSEKKSMLKYWTMALHWPEQN